jgi:hypothetical protein
MGLEGNLRTIVLSDVLQLLSSSRKSGILHVRNARGLVKKIYFREGAIYSTASSDPREYLGHFLISRGYLSEEQLNKAMETQLQTGIKLGKILVMVGILEEPELEAMLTLKAEETLYGLFLWEDGFFVFEEVEAAAEDMFHISLDVTSLIMEGIRRKDEWGRIRGVFPTDRTVLRKGEAPPDSGTAPAGSFLHRVWKAFDGQKCIADVALDLHATEFQVSEAAFRLHAKGFLEAAGSRESPDEITYTSIQRRLLEEAALALEERRFEEAANLYRYLLRTMPDDEEVHRGLSMAEGGACQVYFRDVVPLSTVLVLAVPLNRLASEDLSPQEGFLASRVNGTWDISSILKVSPLTEQEALKAFRKLLEKGILRPKTR